MHLPYRGLPGDVIEVGFTIIHFALRSYLEFEFAKLGENILGTDTLRSVPRHLYSLRLIRTGVV